MNDASSRQTGARRLMETVRAMVRRFSIAERSDIACCGMTVAQAATLEALNHRPPMRLGDLGQRLGITASTLTRNLARIVERGLVTTSPDPTDRRASVIELTRAGRLAAEELSLQEERFFESIIEHLPADDHGRTLDALDNLWYAIRAATEQCCPGAFDHLMEPPAGPERKGDHDVCTTCRP